MGKRAKGGRKRKPGDRLPCGRLRTQHDYGNDKVVAMKAVFRPFQAGKADQWVTESAIGRAWAVGLLEGHGVDSAAIRDAGLDYAARYWGYYPSPSSVANYEGQDQRGHDGGGPDPRGDRFRLFDFAIRSAGASAYEAVQSLTVDQHWFPMDNPAWLDRLITHQRIEDWADRKKRGLVSGETIAGQLPTEPDWKKLKLAIKGLLAIVEGTNRVHVRSAA